jgi:cardiolipin synthase A/B
MNSSSTSWELYASNEDAWAAMLEDCRKATTSISLEQFIFFNDEFGQKLLDIFIERAAAGITVRLLWDAAGSFSLFGSDIVKTLREKGIELVFWKTLIPSYYNVPNLRSWFLRNHRRTLVIDEKVGYTGSICIKDSMKNWRDTNVRLQGPLVHSMQDAFNRMWARARGDKQPPHRKLPRDPEFTYITNSPAPGRRFMHRTMIEAIRGAEKYIYLTTPYFVPTHRIIRILKLAAHRGVDVRILVPQTSNVFAVDLGARSFFDTLLESGARIFLYQGPLIHSKTCVIDGTWSTVGSLNMDAVSLLYNYEANVVSLNSRFAEELSAHFVHDLQDSKEVLLSERTNRFFLEKVPEQLIKLVRNFL